MFWIFILLVGVAVVVKVCNELGVPEKLEEKLDDVFLDKDKKDAEDK